MTARWRGHGWRDSSNDRRDGLWPPFDPDVMELSLRYVTARPFWDEWASTSQPPLLVVGERGIIDQDEVAHMVTARPEITTVGIPDAGHALHLEQPRSLIQALEVFLGV